ncbi:uncharacterized protein, gamma-carboxymuconolactone decarboxylase subunit like protein [Frankia casuarinae]|uniref:Alkylhydroperoxidase n=1 Tax=Frankia casuarinae (strain DSM 45818 / CECT 9043 / HFP020203 / CcI3) TaxID=106370 RepID=Q2J4H5_FRACC|nr:MULTISPECIES: carboxymuconolactone decarboxylase family protein [Frankia]ABD13817.1 alkylhydroperoxidase [Frankia casuarinae]ETA04038.1 uncharacterized protein, gamma-carboxymuconolactone decarboxylase subunit like protein [Frankia sp. CcI6]EYT94284.1 uncharacterized protein, gamma-carboxymuconolactone decarboxylase subunit like protein [Frankia casuarinae]KDA44195.1 uncharacterized protein, gamma-carboxymuconolactone decarboxylase subunit like protein [Frankia sp. BMG5.23]KFB06936.1 alkylh
MSSGSPVQDEIRPHARELRRLIPDVYRGLGTLGDAALRDGALDSRTKELIALALAVSTQCDGCIEAHAHGAVRQGATCQEAAEAIGVALLMNGGPASVYGPRAFAAFRRFRAERHEAGDGTAPLGHVTPASPGHAPSTAQVQPPGNTDV